MAGTVYQKLVCASPDINCQYRVCNNCGVNHVNQKTLSANIKPKSNLPTGITVKSVYPTVTYYKCPYCTENVIEYLVFVSNDLNKDACMVKTILARPLSLQDRVPVLQHMWFCFSTTSGTLLMTRINAAK